MYYNSRRQVDELLEKARNSEDMDKVITFGQKRDPCVSFFGKVKSSFQPIALDRSHPQLYNVGVTVKPNMPGMPKDMLAACTDANQIKHSHMETLEPVGVTDQAVLHPDLKVMYNLGDLCFELANNFNRGLYPAHIHNTIRKQEIYTTITLTSAHLAPIESSKPQQQYPKLRFWQLFPVLLHTYTLFS